MSWGFVMMFSLLFLFAVARGADAQPDLVCPPEPRATLVEVALEVERAWLELDGFAYELARSRLARLAPCVREPLSSEDALALHRAQGLVAYVDGDQDAALRAFAAVHALDPGWTPPEQLVPREHPLWRVFEASVGVPRLVPFRVPPQHGWFVDGTRYPREVEGRGPHKASSEMPGLPADRAFVLQVLDRRGLVAYTGYHFSTTDVPVQELALVHDKALTQRQRRRDARVRGSVVGGALVAGAGVAFGLGWHERQQLKPGVDVLDVLPHQSKANTLGGVSYGLAGAGALAFTLAWSVPW